MNENYNGLQPTDEECKQLDEIITLVAEYCNIPKHVFFKGKRIVDYVFARAIYLHWAKFTTNISGSKIVTFLGYTPAMHSHYNRLYKEDISFRDSYDKFKLKQIEMASIEYLLNKRTAGYPEIRAKFEFLELIIRLRFKTQIYLNVNLNFLKSEISVFKPKTNDDKDFQRRYFGLCSYAESFINEFYDGDPKLFSEFKSKGLTNGKDS